MARSSGRPSRLLRSALVTNSSISLPTWRVMPRMMAPAISFGNRAPSNSIGLRKPSIRPMLSSAKVGIEAVDRLGQHRVAEPVDDVRELGDDGRIDGDVVAVGHQEDVDVRLDLARELLEHEVLVLHLGAELRGLEQAFAVPVQACPRRPPGLTDRSASRRPVRR